MSGLPGPTSERSPFAHEPVMATEVVAAFAEVPPGLIVDATVGGGGHAGLILGALPQLDLLGLDQDGEALSAAADALEPFGSRVRLRRARFDHLAGALNDEGLGEGSDSRGPSGPSAEQARADSRGPSGPPAEQARAGFLSGIFFDLGVSSYQLDEPSRGFSYRHEGPIDMRMDPRGGISAADIVNGYEVAELARVIAEGSDERFAGRIAKAIAAARPIESTTQLAEVVRSAIPAPARRRGGHPAKRTFQALRMEVNQEIPTLERALDQALGLLAPGGCCVVISYHSGEDRVVKEAFRRAATGGCTCPPGLPCACGAEPTVKLPRRGARKPTAAEIESNPRAASARLRVAERLASTPSGDLGIDGPEGSDR